MLDGTPIKCELCRTTTISRNASVITSLHIAVCIHREPFNEERMSTENRPRYYFPIRNKHCRESVDYRDYIHSHRTMAHRFKWLIINVYI